MTKDPDHRFLWFLCKTFQKTPDSDWIENIDPFLRFWMQEQWKQDYVEDNDTARYYAILNGAFFNHEMASQMLKVDKPDYQSSDEDFDVSTKMMTDDIEKEGKIIKKRRRRRRVLKDNR